MQKGKGSVFGGETSRTTAKQKPTVAVVAASTYPLNQETSSASRAEGAHLVEGSLRWNNADQDVLLHAFAKFKGDWAVASEAEEIKYLYSKNYRDVHEKWNRLLMHYRNKYMASGDKKHATKQENTEGTATPSSKSGVHKDNSWSKEEVKALTSGYSKYGRDWGKILHDPALNPALKSRSLFSLKSKWSRIQQSTGSKSRHSNDGESLGEPEPSNMSQSSMISEESKLEEHEGVAPLKLQSVDELIPIPQAPIKRPADIVKEEPSKKRSNSRRQSSSSAIDRSWTYDEVSSLEKGFERYGSDWKSILADPEFAPHLQHRSVFSLKSKWGRLSKRSSTKSRYSQRSRSQESTDSPSPLRRRRSYHEDDDYTGLETAFVPPIRQESTTRDKKIEAFALNLRALAAYDAKKYQQCLADLTDALRRNINFVEGYLNRALLYNAMGEHESAILDCCLGIELELDSTTGLIVRSIVYTTKDMYRNALEDVDVAIRMDPEDVMTICLRALILFRMIRRNDQQFFESMPIFEQTMKRFEVMLDAPTDEKSTFFRHIWEFMRSSVALNSGDEYEKAGLVKRGESSKDKESMLKISGMEIAEIKKTMETQQNWMPRNNQAMIFDALESLCSLHSNRFAAEGLSGTGVYQDLVFYPSSHSSSDISFDLPDRSRSHDLLATLEDSASLHFSTAPGDDRLFFCPDFGADAIEDTPKMMNCLEQYSDTNEGEGIDRRRSLSPLIDPKIIEHQKFLVSPIRSCSNSFDPHSSADVDFFGFQDASKSTPVRLFDFRHDYFSI